MQCRREKLKLVSILLTLDSVFKNEMWKLKYHLFMIIPPTPTDYWTTVPSLCSFLSADLKLLPVLFPMCVFLCMCLSVFRQKGIQVLQYNASINRLLLEVNVSNTPSLGRPAEDAHNAVLNISIPTSLIYSGVRTKVVGFLHQASSKYKTSRF